MEYCSGRTYTGAPCPYVATRGTRCGIHCVKIDANVMRNIFPKMFTKSL